MNKQGQTFGEAGTDRDNQTVEQAEIAAGIDKRTSRIRTNRIRQLNKEG